MVDFPTLDYKKVLQSTCDPNFLTIIKHQAIPASKASEGPQPSGKSKLF